MRSLPLDIRSILTIGEYAFRRVVSGWFIRLLAVAAVGVAAWLFQDSPDPQKDLLSNRAFCFDLISLSAAVLVIVMGATDLPRDIDTKTILIVLSKPVSKDDVVAGKFLGLVYVAAFATLVMAATLALGCVVKGLLDPDNLKAGVYPDANFLQKTGFVFVQTGVLAAAVMLLSTRLSELPIIAFSAMYAVISIFVFYIMVILKVHPDLPPALEGALLAAYYAFPNFKYFQMPQDFELQGAIGWLEYAGIWGYGALYSTILVWLSLWSFKGRHVAG